VIINEIVTANYHSFTFVCSLVPFKASRLLLGSAPYPDMAKEHSNTSSSLCFIQYNTKHQYVTFH